MSQLLLGRRSLVAAGFLSALLLHVGAGWWTPAAFAQGTNTTFSNSTSSSTSFESPPACGPVGSSRTVQTVTVETTIGPGSVLTGNRDTGGTLFIVVAGTVNLNTNVHTTTFQCIAAVPALPWLAWLTTALGLALLGLGFKVPGFQGSRVLGRTL